MAGQVIGRAGGGLVDPGGWADAPIGVARTAGLAEQRTASVLNALAHQGDLAVLHDLDMPIPGVRANIDHVVVAGRSVLVIDTKWWAPGLLWTFRGRTRRGTAAFPACDKRTLAMAQASLQRYLGDLRPSARVERPVALVWSSSAQSRPSLWAARIPGGRLVHADRLGNVVAGLGGAPADQQVVARLARLARG